MSLKLIKILAFSFILLLTGCGKEIGKLVFNSGKVQETTINVTQSKPLQFWVELNVKYTGQANIGFGIIVMQNNRQVAKVRCNAQDVNVKINSVITSINGRVSKRYTGKMRCSIRLPDGGATIVKAQPLVSGGVQVKKMNLVLKQ